jgi:hypothetical protein
MSMTVNCERNDVDVTLTVTVALNVDRDSCRNVNRAIGA